MCLKCSAPTDRYYVRDWDTGLIVCEECGFAYRDDGTKGLTASNYIWFLNPLWPVFHTFEELFDLVARRDIPLPRFSVTSRYPSRLYTAVLELMHQKDIEITEQ